MTSKRGYGREIEGKYRITCATDDIREILSDMGAKFNEILYEEDMYFSHPCRDFSKTDEALRLRHELSDGNEKWILTYKGPRTMANEIKKREEIEITVADKHSLLGILNRLGFRRIAVIRKKRLVHLYNDCKILMDKVENLGEFLEIECRDSEQIEYIRSRLMNCLEPVKETYLELYRAAGVSNE